MQDAINFAALAAALLSRGAPLLEQWLPDGKQEGYEYKCASLSGGRGGSCSINLTNGKWSDFATGEAGNDWLSLYKAIFNHATMAAAAVAVAHDYGLEDVGNIKAPRPGEAPPPRALPPPVPAQEDKSGKWRAIMPVPDTAPAFKFKHWHYNESQIDHLAAYVRDGVRYGYIARVIRSEGGKEPLPYVWAESTENSLLGWINKGMPEPRPLYLPGGTSPGTRTVILVEGEKKAWLLQELLDAACPDVYCVASWPGGSNAWSKADWSWLAGCTVLAWPDCDAKRVKLPRDVAKELQGDPLEWAKAAQPLLPESEQPGMKAMLGIGALLKKEHGCTVSLLAIPKPLEVPDGWDCADAIADGWDAQRVLAFFGTAYDLPASASNVVPLRSAKAEKTDDPAKAGDGGSGNGGGEPPDGGEGGTEPPKGTPKWLEPYWDRFKKRWNVGRKLVIKALENDQLLQDVLAYDQLRNQPVARIEWPWVHGRAGPIDSTTELLLGKWLSETYGLPAISMAALTEGIYSVAYARPYHPVQQWLAGLEWDGTPRLSKWLLHVLGHTPGQLRAKTEDYIMLVGRMWLIAMVRRVMQPGCKFDYMPVLEGAGGVGKSTLARALAGSDFFSDTAFQIGQGKDGFEQLRGIWLYELAELSHMNRAEANAVKGFVSSQVDRYRGAYGRTVDAFPRQCVFVGTTNEKQYLQDRTGNRRFWPIPCPNALNVKFVEKWRDQLFAEAYRAYEANEPCWPTREQEAELFSPMQDARLKETAVASALHYMLTRPAENNEVVGGGVGQKLSELSLFVRIDQLCLALGADAGKAGPQVQNEVRAWLESQGWERCKKSIGGVRAWGYARPTGWPFAEPDDLDEASQPPVGDANGDDDDVPF